MKYPLLSILGATLVLSGCGGGGSASSASVSFTPISAADANEIQYGSTSTQLAADSPLRQVVTTPSMDVYGVTVPLTFTPIIKSGDQPDGGATWGEPIKQDGTTFGATNITSYTGAVDSAYLKINNKRVSYSPDHSTLLQKGGKLFSITQFENTNGSMYITELNQAVNGVLSAVKTKPIDLSGIFGGWDFCAGIPTAWGSHLGGEEYPDDARQFETYTTGSYTLNNPSSNLVIKFFDEYLEYFGLDPAQTNSSSKANPTRATAYAKTSIYRIGFPVEVKLTSTELGTGATAANTSVAKHYSMGRLAWELAYVMPDQKTVYMGDDGAFRGMFRYVANTAGDLTAGKLYAAKLTQTSADNGGTFTIAWNPIYTGAGTDAMAVTDAEIDSLIASGIQFSNMIDYVAPTNNTCPSGYTPYVLRFNSVISNECIKLKGANGAYTADQVDKAASRLETLRYAVIKGATQEFEKFEGVTFDPSRNKLYIAISSIANGMVAGDANNTQSNDIAITANKCGAIYQLDVDSNYVTTNMKTLIAGAVKTYNNREQCDLDKIGMPDNVVMGPTNDYILIGEDSDWLTSSKNTDTSSKRVHRNDVLWAYDLKNSKLTRIFSTPVGGEVTSPMYYRNINGWDYITVVVQHPYNESDTDQASWDSLDRRAIFGVIGPISTFTPK